MRGRKFGGNRRVIFGRSVHAGRAVAYGLADPGNTGEDGSVRDTTFLHNYLHANYIADDAAAASVRGVEGDPVGNGAAITITGGLPNNDAPDVIEPRAGAVPVFHYSGSQQRAAGLRYQGDGSRMIYLGFGLEGIGNARQRYDLLNRGIA